MKDLPFGEKLKLSGIGKIYSLKAMYFLPFLFSTRLINYLKTLKGKVVLLDFSVFQSPAGAPHNMMLRELYNKYAKDGLEIYQVSLDADEHYWKTAAGNLPWV